jgi:hypothetical protein
VRFPRVSGIFPNDVIRYLGRADLDIRGAGVRTRKLMASKTESSEVREISERFRNLACTTHSFHFYAAKCAYDGGNRAGQKNISLCMRSAPCRLLPVRLIFTTLPSLSHSTPYHVCRGLSDSQFSRLFHLCPPQSRTMSRRACRCACVFARYNPGHVARAIYHVYAFTSPVLSALPTTHTI